MRSDELSLPDPPGNDRPANRFKCGRLGESGACSHGPSGKGVCPFHKLGKADQVCVPTQTWAGNRRKLVVANAALLVLVLVAVGILSDPAWWAKPGDLTSAHAQLLANLSPQGESGTQNQACATCHSEAARDPLGLFRLGKSAHESVDLTSKCIDCHHATTPPGFARMAHNLSQAARAEIRGNLVAQTGGISVMSLLGTAVDQESVSCSVCHREHQGSFADLTAMTDAQCQTCHSVQFSSFAGNHPDFTEYPTANHSAVAFDHSTHFQKHFPDSSAKLTATQRSDLQDCQSCHAIDATGDTVLRVSYDKCSVCHDEAIRVATTSIDWFALPTVPEEVFAGKDGSRGQVSKWPEAATGWFDGRVSPLMQLMLRNDGVSNDQIQRLRGGDLSGLDGENLDDLKLGRDVATRMAMLLRDVAADGQAAIQRRMASAGVPEEVVARLLADLSPQLVDSATGTWFSPQLSTPKRFDSAGKLINGGWYRDDLTMSLSYRGRGHQDDVVRGLVELAASLPTDDAVGIQLRDSLAVRSCTQCHVSAADVFGAWVTSDSVSESPGHLAGRSLTRFHHGPHLTSKQGGGCVDCHRLESSSGPQVHLASFPAPDGPSNHHGFADIQKSACIACHNQSTGADSCVTCHGYHAR